MIPILQAIIASRIDRAIFLSHAIPCSRSINQNANTNNISRNMMDRKLTDESNTLPDAFLRKTPGPPNPSTSVVACDRVLANGTRGTPRSAGGTKWA
jgi:hypothetical protein